MLLGQYLKENNISEFLLLNLYDSSYLQYNEDIHSNLDIQFIEYQIPEHIQILSIFYPNEVKK